MPLPLMLLLALSRYTILTSSESFVAQHILRASNVRFLKNSTRVLDKTTVQPEELMRLFHPRIRCGLVHPRIPIPEVWDISSESQSEWAQAFASFIAQFRERHPLIVTSDSRTHAINFDALKHSVESGLGKIVMAMEWVAEGGSNQVYLLVFDDGTQAIARIMFPFPHRIRTGEAFASQEDDDRLRQPYRMQSQVDTINFLRKYTDLPIPEVYFYDNRIDNAVGAPFMIGELAAGDILGLRSNGIYPYNDMSLEQRLAVMKSLGNILGRIMHLQFDSFGSLTSQGSDDITVGPLVDPIRSLHRDCNLIDAGPWSSDNSCALFVALAARELQWLTSELGLQLFHQYRSEMHPKEDSTKTYPVFVDLCKALLDVIPHMYLLFPVPPQMYHPVLSHPDYHFSNIIVSREDPTLVTGVIDWECAAVLPLWDAYSVPDMIVDEGDQYELNVRVRDEKRQLREAYEQAVIDACPDVACMVAAMDTAGGSNTVGDSLEGLRALSKIATNGVALYESGEKVKARLVKLRQLCATDAPPNVVQIFERHIETFSNL